MEKQIKTIGVLTSGGDAPGMNAAVRAVVRTGLHKGFRMIGIQRGYNGLLNGECFEMNLRSVSNIISAGGTILYTARCLEFKTKEGQDKGAAKCRELGIDALVVIGGDGSYRGARELAHRGIPMIGLPGTIDNDIACTDYTIGYDTAMNTALEMIDKLRDTTQSLQCRRGHGPQRWLHCPECRHRLRRYGRAAAREGIRYAARHPR